MKALNKYNFYFLILFSGIIFSDCSHKTTLVSTSVVPGAEGSVRTKKDNNNNYSIHLKIVNLASPEMLTPPKKEYVVWMVNDQNESIKMGRLTSSRGVTQTKTGSLSTVTTFKPVSFFITAEDDPNTAFPGPIIVLRSK